MDFLDNQINHLNDDLEKIGYLSSQSENENVHDKEGDAHMQSDGERYDNVGLEDSLYMNRSIISDDEEEYQEPTFNLDDVKQMNFNAAQDAFFIAKAEAKHMQAAVNKVDQASF